MRYPMALQMPYDKGSTSSGEPKNQWEKRRNTHCLTTEGRSLGISASRTSVFRVKRAQSWFFCLLFVLRQKVSRGLGRKPQRGVEILKHSTEGQCVVAMRFPNLCPVEQSYNFFTVRCTLSIRKPQRGDKIPKHLAEGQCVLSHNVAIRFPSIRPKVNAIKDSRQFVSQFVGFVM